MIDIYYGIPYSSLNGCLLLYSPTNDGFNYKVTYTQNLGVKPVVALNVSMEDMQFVDGYWEF